MYHNDRKNQILIEDILNLDSIYSAKLIILDVSFHNLKNFYPELSNENYLKFVKKIIDKADHFTKFDSICCLISMDQKENENLESFGTKVIQDTGSWNVIDEIIWVKDKDDSNYKSELDSSIIVDYEQTPFSQIWIMSKQKLIPTKEELVMKLHISEQKKNHILDSIWYIQPSSFNGYVDNLPVELLSRLIMIYSNEGEFVIDPFSDKCLTAIVCKSLKRDYLCLTNTKTNLNIGLKRLGE